MQPKAYLSFVGLGWMGQPMAMNLLQAIQGEMDICVFDRQAERMTPLVTCGARAAERLGAVAHEGGIVFSMVPDDRTLLQIALGEGGILKQLGKGGIHVSCSTVSPQVSRQLDKLYQKSGNTYVTAPILGDPDVAERGELTFFLAGKSAAKQRVKPLLVTMGKRLFDLGEQVEAANVATLAGRLLIASAIEALGEAAALAEEYGLDRVRFLEIMRRLPPFQGSVYQEVSRMIGTRDFSEKGFPVQEGLREVELAIQIGQQKDLDLPHADVAYEHLLAAQEAGRGQEDWSAFSDFARRGASSGLFSTAAF